MPRKNKLPSFKVINWNFNGDRLEWFDIMPFIYERWKEKKGKKTKVWLDHKDQYRTGKDMPITFEEFRAFIDKECMYIFWSRVQYEVVITDFPCGKNSVKIDVYTQIRENLDTITKLFMDFIYS